MIIENEKAMLPELEEVLSLEDDTETEVAENSEVFMEVPSVQSFRGNESWLSTDITRLVCRLLTRQLSVEL